MGNTLSDFACLGLVKKAYADGYADALRGNGCLVSGPSSKASSPLYSAVCDVTNDATGTVAAQVVNLRKICADDGGSFNQDPL